MILCGGMTERMGERSGAVEGASPPSQDGNGQMTEKGGAR